MRSVIQHAVTLSPESPFARPDDSAVTVRHNRAFWVEPEATPTEIGHVQIAPPTPRGAATFTATLPRTWRTGGAMSLVLMVAAVLLFACAPRVEPEPKPLDVTPRVRPTAPLPDAGSRAVTVFFVRAGRLAAVERAVDDPTISAALALLLVGPTPAEAARGIRTALLPGALLPAASKVTGSTAIVEGSPRLTHTSGDNQILAIAQIVWTVTEHSPVDSVIVTVDGRRIEIPTEAGLTGALVSRGDYASLAPAPPPPTSILEPTADAAYGVAAASHTALGRG